MKAPSECPIKWMRSSRSPTCTHRSMAPALRLGQACVRLNIYSSTIHPERTSSTYIEPPARAVVGIDGVGFAPHQSCYSNKHWGLCRCYVLFLKAVVFSSRSNVSRPCAVNSADAACIIVAMLFIRERGQHRPFLGGPASSSQELTQHTRLTLLYTTIRSTTATLNGATIR